jgi:hypothetical protein
MTEIIEHVIRDGLVSFSVGDIELEAYFIYPADRPGLVKHENQWCLRRQSRHSHRQGRPIKAKKQRPRYKVLGYFDALDSMREFVSTVAANGD